MRARYLRLGSKKARELSALKKEAERDGAFRVAKRIHAVLLNHQRHSSGEIATLLEAPRSKVSLWLGHSDLTTTEVYVRADPSEKLEAIEAVVPPSLRKGKFRPPDKLLALLKVKP